MDNPSKRSPWLRFLVSRSAPSATPDNASDCAETRPGSARPGLSASAPGSIGLLPGAARFLVDAYACFLIPAYTLLFAGREWLTTNFSVLAVEGLAPFVGFVQWGVLLAFYFLALLWALSRQLRRGWAVRAVGLTACACLAAALVLPYVPDALPGFARWHVILAFTASVLLMLCLLMVLLELERTHPGRYRRLLWAWLVLAAGCGALFILAGIISSALEIWFAIGAAQLARRTWMESF